MFQEKIKKNCFVFPAMTVVEILDQDILLFGSNDLVPDLMTQGVDEYETKIIRK